MNLFSVSSQLDRNRVLRPAGLASGGGICSATERTLRPLLPLLLTDRSGPIVVPRSHSRYRIQPRHPQSQPCRYIAGTSERPKAAPSSSPRRPPLCGRLQVRKMLVLRARPVRLDRARRLGRKRNRSLPPCTFSPTSHRGGTLIRSQRPTLPARLRARLQRLHRTATDAAGRRSRAMESSLTCARRRRAGRKNQSQQERQ